MPIRTILSDARLPVKIWTANVEEEAKQQLRNTANLPFVFKHVAAMPDVHFGKGATVGSVVATRGAICPATVGVDIGCGMAAARLLIQKEKVLDKLPQIYKAISRSVPVGDRSNSKLTPSVESWQGWSTYPQTITGESTRAMKKAAHQIGSLGGGNHFIEICLDTKDRVWVLLHSGSRGIGNMMASRHIEIAKGVMKKFFIDLPDPDLSYFVQETAEFDAYIRDLNWCQGYALENRNEVMRRVLREIDYYTREAGEEPLKQDEYINCHHNYCEMEHHFGTNVLVTRKGAVRARKGDLGIIPGSMGTRSYVVRGLGNVDSFNSCPHGAGRRFSRNKARKLSESMSKEELRKQTEGVLCRKDGGIIDELPFAYKSIDEVMENSNDLVEVVEELKQVMCIKG